MKLVIIDGQSGRMGALLAERIKAAKLPCEVLAVGTNAIATAAMMKAGADQGATGENPVLVACRTADVIAGPIGILSADALLGEITPAMAVAVGQSPAKKLLLPVNRNCGHTVVGVRDLTLSASGSVQTVCIGGVRVKGTELRRLYALRSTTFELEAQGGKLIFYVTGFGHGVGMSQYGANEMAKEGATWQEIIRHYYSGVEIGTYALH